MSEISGEMQSDERSAGPSAEVGPNAVQCSSDRCTSPGTPRCSSPSTPPSGRYSYRDHGSPKGSPKKASSKAPTPTKRRASSSKRLKVISLDLAISRHISLYLHISPYISLYLPSSSQANVPFFSELRANLIALHAALDTPALRGLNKVRGMSRG